MPLVVLSRYDSDACSGELGGELIVATCSDALVCDSRSRMLIQVGGEMSAL